MYQGEVALGQKIKKYRVRSKLSQFELEDLIGASPGSLSRIENGQINPTKETLRKIIFALDLKISESANLFDLNLEEFPKIIRLARKINSSLKMDDLLDNSVNDIMYDLGLSGVAIFLIEGNYLYAVAIDDAPPGRSALLKLLGLSKFRLRIALDKKSENICVKCVLEGKPYYSYDACDFTRDVLSRNITNLIVKISEFKSGAVLPMFVDKEVIGAVMYMKAVSEDFKNDYGVLEAFTEYLSSSIVNAREYEKAKLNITN